MCTMIVENVDVSGSGKGPGGWFKLKKANVSYDHPFHAPIEHSINVDFVDETGGLEANVAVELTAESARNLVTAINTALSRGEVYKLDETSKLISL